MGSLAEVKYLLDFSLKLKYLTSEQHKKLQGLDEEVGKVLWGFYKSLQEDEGGRA